MSSTFAPSLTAAIIFRHLGSHDRYRKRGLHLPIDENKLVKVQGFSHKEVQGGNINAFRPQSDQSTYSSYQEMKGCRSVYKLNTQIH